MAVKGTSFSYFCKATTIVEDHYAGWKRYPNEVLCMIMTFYCIRGVLTAEMVYSR